MTASEPPTTVSLLTPTGRGAVAVVAVSGPAAVTSVDACFLARNGKPLTEQRIGRIVYGHWGSTEGEDLVVCRVAIDEVEVHCHGGSASVEEVLRSLSATGCQQITWQDWVKSRAASPIEAEAQIALAAAPTQRTAEVLSTQLQGALARELEGTRQDLTDGKLDRARERIAELLSWSEVGLHLTRPWQVTIAGKPNVGKSSLLNAMLGYNRAIVADLPGTTRDVVSTTTAYGGWQLALSDTAGLRESIDELEAAGIARAREKLSHTDLVVWVFDAEQLLVPPDSSIEMQFASLERELGIDDEIARIFVINKIDRISKKGTQLFSVNELRPLFLTSALTGAGVPELFDAIVRRLVPREPAPQQAVPFTVRQVENLVTAQVAVEAGDIGRAEAFVWKNLKF